MNKRDGVQMSNKQINIWAYLLILIGPSLLLSNRCNQVDRSSMRITTLNKRQHQCDESLVSHYFFYSTKNDQKTKLEKGYSPNPKQPQTEETIEKDWGFL